MELRNAIAETAKKKKHIEADPLTEIIVTNGGMQALYFEMHTLTNPGDEIIIGSPYFTNYLGQVFGCKIIAYDPYPNKEIEKMATTG